MRRKWWLSTPVRNAGRVLAGLPESVQVHAIATVAEALTAFGRGEPEHRNDQEWRSAGRGSAISVIAGDTVEG
ncbi:hypothetical protein [Nocardia sp. NPDC051570]|uniref:hypothetical protein n=1 Tax=Nocardia sp. NPDC051570 TaxID=3364324 RepID=UPI00379E220C